MNSHTVRRLSATLGMSALIATSGLLAGCGKSGESPSPTTTTTTTTTTSVSPTENTVNPGSQTFTPAPPDHRGNVG
ncbi:hypothetical protein [Mycolicibacterium sp. CBMA 226]|uniref:hypothetical protein n=1 Tax=Mycolicibacterium sp. CBMA 226 TaxID=2606611 RepID=UPI0012DC3178|nr:hypothetical protein [Mycolicibacterium sp. CBMA 226]MUL76830.1 hypothetical protein [Mycolicibacterium sp. CBMA 226]